ncbi:MAG: hypothetical protein JW850_16365, partial [Thermoflexales bacterium]|nr:hypothetical protein [Thermoflexales bacterium]
STNETSFAILALTDHLLAVEAATEDTAYSVELNGKEIASGALGRGEPAVSLAIAPDQMAEGANILRLRQSGGGRLYYQLNSRVYLAQAQIEPAGDVRVSRRYLDDKGAPLESFRVGQLVKIELTVKLPEDGFYIIVEDSLPGGLEALNEGLNTSSHEGLAYEEVHYWWQQYGYNYKEVRPDRVTFFITEVGQGTHTYTYVARATRVGDFAALPTEVYAMYDVTTWGRSASARLVVTGPEGLRQARLPGMAALAR